ncbi:FecR family protein [Aeoliella mucimassa]|uniref:FecR protein n=1 Tax=Aeoliella mucimassa TaxID=2527972 RepID=A0A518APP9_9BACT|nr:FecR family protein [Aeoliella mucimassa]QDU56697.1 FecR protein [Aeoliella mucimassa]
MGVPSTTPEFNSQRLQDLTLAKCYESLSEGGVQELSSILSSSAEARSEYYRLVSVHSELEIGLRSSEENYHESCFDSSLLSDIRTEHRGVSTRNLWQLCTAACLLVAIGGASVMWWYQEPANLANNNSIPPDVPVTPVALVCRITPLTKQPEWTLGRIGVANKDEVLQGDTLFLKGGAVKLDFTSGTSAVLNSPLVMQIVSVDRVRLMEGGMKVDVPKGAEGFRVESDSAEIVDLGTSFSVNVNDGDTNLVVFDGEVDLKSINAHRSGEPADDWVVKRFVAGEAVLISKEGTLSRIVQVQQPTLDHGEDGAPLQSVITSVRDSIKRNDFFGFYEIIPRGMHEEAFAFVDRVHEWNGVTADGMPSYLIGGDLVKTFNSDKLTDELKIILELAEPSAVYILLDPRVPTPEWLMTTFENTGDLVGLDENRDGKQNGIGPGDNIDREFSVWRCEYPNAGAVTLGPNGTEGYIRNRKLGQWAMSNMYGIVVVPLDDAK